MLPSLGFQEILLLGVLALVVIGPKDLPLMLRKLGRWTARLRGMAQEFRSGFDELARQAELDELKREVEALRRTTNLSSLANEITKPLPTLEDYAGLSAPRPVQAAPPDGPARLDADDAAVPPVSLPAPEDRPASRDNAFIDEELEREPIEAQPVARSAP